MSDEKLLEEAKTQYGIDYEYYSQEYARAEEDIEFTMGDQWPEQIKEKRRKEGRPCLTENRLLPYVHQVANEVREMRPSVKISAVDDKGDVDTADVLKGMIRNIERQSKADTAYDKAVFNTVTSGYGWIRINLDYASPMSFDQEIKIERVLNPLSVIFDSNSTELDGSDAEHAFVYEDVPREMFKEMYPDADPVSWKESNGEVWADEHTIRVMEYFYKDYTDVTIYETVLPDGVTKALVKKQLDILDEQGIEYQVLQDRETRIPSIKWCKFTESDVLEKTEWLGKYIPIVPVYGMEVYLKNKRQSHSLIRQARDPQTMFNFWKTASAEIIALQPRAPYVGALGQFNSRAKNWATSNNENYAFLEYDQVDLNGQLAPPPQRAQPIMGSPAMFQSEQMAATGISATLGMYEEGRGEASNAISGIAIRSRELSGKNATFHFIDNLAASIRHVGVILVDLIPRIYDKPRIARILGEDGEEKPVPINQPFVKTDDGLQPAMGKKADGIYDLQAGKYDVDVDVGPSYATKRQETVDFITAIAQREPRILEVAGDLLFKSMDTPYSEEIAKRIKSIMSPELLDDDPMAAKLEQASKAMQQMQEQLDMALAALEDKKKNEQVQNAIDMKEVQIKEQDVQIKAAKTAADIKKIESEIQGGGGELQSVISAVLELSEQVQDTGQALDIILASKEEEANEMPLQNLDNSQEVIDE